jgi:hypothetical protein
LHDTEKEKEKKAWRVYCENKRKQKTRLALSAHGGIM